MRVLMTADTVGGVWTYAMELTRALADVDFVLATMGARATPWQRAEIAPNVRLVESDYKLEWQDEPWTDLQRAGEWLLELENDGFDVIHLNGYSHAALPFRARKLVVAHSCVMSWWRAVKDEDAPPEWSRYRETVERGLRGAALVVAPSAWMLGALDQHYRFETPTRLIYNGRSGGGGGRKQSIVFAAGRLWDDAKNLRAVVAAADHIDWPVHIAGDGGTDARNVIHLGHLDRDAIAGAYAAASIYLFPALYEPFGLSILEAALAGCALVIGDIPSLRELWADAAVFVPPRDPDAIARAVDEVIANDGFRDELARRARARAADYTPERMAAGYRAVYSVLGKEAAA